jgi:hypothetical protein
MIHHMETTNRKLHCIIYWSTFQSICGGFLDLMDNKYKKLQISIYFWRKIRKNTMNCILESYAGGIRIFALVIMFGGGALCLNNTINLFIKNKMKNPQNPNKLL